MSHTSPTTNQDSRLLALPAEIRIAILEHVFEDDVFKHGFLHHNEHGGILLDDLFEPSHQLRPFSACRQLHHEGNEMAWNKTNFTSSRSFSSQTHRLYALKPWQIAAIRNLTIVTDTHCFRDLLRWGNLPFGHPDLRLDTLAIVVHSGGRWHDLASGITSLLRRLRNVRRMVFVRNGALVKGSFRMWYNRLVGMMLKVDHFERYDRVPSNPEDVWWTWKYDPIAQTGSLEAQPPKPLMGEEPYMQLIKPLMEELKKSIETEDTMSGALRHDGWGWNSNPLTS